MASASKWVGGALVALGALTDVGALSASRTCPQTGLTFTEMGGEHMHGTTPCGQSPTGGLVVGTGMAAAGVWLWSQKAGSHRTRHSSTRRAPRYTGRSR